MIHALDKGSHVLNLAVEAAGAAQSETDEPRPIFRPATQTFRIDQVSVLRFRSRVDSPDAGARRRGARRYSIRRPAFEEFLADGDFRSALNRIADAQNRPAEQAVRRAEHYLKEIAARPSRPMVIVGALLGRILYRRAYGVVHYNREDLAALSELSARHPVVFLPCHRSNLDRPVMHYLLWKNNLGPNFTAGGINMNFFPIGPISRRAGVFFIRRSFANSPVYKLVLQTYFAYLIEQRLPLEWYMEGGRSRTGKLRSPRYGLLGYAADALLAGKTEDIHLIPTSINYDHVLEIGDYAAQESGIAKEKETFGWLVKSVRSLQKRHGDIHVGFGEPLSMRSMIDPDRTGTERRQDLQRLATAVCMRVNRITPVTPTSLVVVALLAAPEGGIPRIALEATVAELVEDVEFRNLPTSETLSLLRTRRGFDDVVGALVDLGIAADGDEAPEPRRPQPAYRIAAGQRLAASYYRNTIVHFFLTPAIAELALEAASRGDGANRPTRTFHEYVAKLRDLFAYEFFFEDQDALADEMAIGLDRHLPGWRDRLAEGQASEVVEGLRPHRAPWALRSFLDAYLVVAEELVDLPPEQPWNKRSFLQSCLDRGAEYAARGRISAEASSLSLFTNALRLAGHRGLLKPGLDDLSKHRRAFVSELSHLLELVGSLDSGPPAGEESTSGDTPSIPS